jgi:DNA-binding NarL/FixJ family response regulator
MADHEPPRIRVLLVDDHEMVAESFQRVLSSSRDIEVIGIAVTAADGVAAARAHAPDVIVMDEQLPDERGVAAAARIKAELPHIRVLLLTGSGDSGTLQAALEAGCIGYLEKTSAFGRLIAAVRSAAAGDVVISREDLSRLVVSRERLGGTRAPELTRRELQVLHLVGAGLSNQAIAKQLVLSVNTVRTHVQTILEKLGAHSKLEAVVVAMKQGLVRHE